MKVLEKIKDSSVVIFWCPGCEENHQIDTSVWGFNGDLEKPTFAPSYLTWVDANPKADPKYNNGKYYNGFRCHSFIRDGQIEYMGDCTHKLAGQTISMVEVDSK